MGELELRRIQLMANYWLDCRDIMTLIPQKQYCMIAGKISKNLKKNFGRIGNNVAKELEVFNLRISPTGVFPEIAPWKITWPEVDWFVHEEKRKEKQRK